MQLELLKVFLETENCMNIRPVQFVNSRFALIILDSISDLNIEEVEKVIP